MGKSNRGIIQIVIVLAIIVFLASSFFLILSALSDGVKQFFKSKVAELKNKFGSLTKKTSAWLAIKRIKGKMFICNITYDRVGELKSKIEALGIDADNVGITEIMLSKMLLTQIATASIQNSLCVAEVKEEEIIRGTEYTKVDDYLEKSLTNQQQSEDINDYTLYYLTDSFFYFKDTDGFINDQKKDQYYLGTMGKIRININPDGMGDSGPDIKSLEYVTPKEFNDLGTAYQNLGSQRGLMGKDRDSNKAGLFGKYTYNEEGQILVYKLIQSTLHNYTYIFEFDKPGDNPKDTRVSTTGTDDDAVFTVEKTTIDIESDVDASKYSVTVDFLLTLLTLTGSPQYVDRFMDYAIANTEITVSACLLENEGVTYNKKTYNIEQPYIYELYDMVQGADRGDDNMLTYKPLIYDRKYKKNDETSEEVPYTSSLVSLPDWVNINYNRRPLVKNGEDAFSECDKISKYLLLAYDPPTSTPCPCTNLRAKEITANTTYENHWDFTLDSVDTWYGKIEYGKPNIITEYALGGVVVQKNEYDNFDPVKDMNMEDLTPLTTKEINKYVLVHNGITAGTGIPGSSCVSGSLDSETKTKTIIDVLDSNDIYDNILNKELGKNNKSRFELWTLKGLGKVSVYDDGKINGETGMGKGSDYLYAKYTKKNLKELEIIKEYESLVEDSTNLPTCNYDKVYAFLALWKSQTGIPMEKNPKYQSDGIKVEYRDIYNSTTAVGDIFESAPEMLFSVLGQSETTRDLVDVFKYIMYIYTQRDYGISQPQQITNLFSLEPYAGSNYAVNTAFSPSEYVLEKGKLSEAIKKTYDGNVEKNLLDNLDAFVKIQDENKVNAVSAIAWVVLQTNAGTYWDACEVDPSTNNWFYIPMGSNPGETIADPWFEPNTRKKMAKV